MIGRLLIGLALALVIWTGPARAACPNGGICGLAAEDVDLYSASGISFSTTAGTFLNDGVVPVRGSIQVPAGGSFSLSPFAFQNPIWLHFVAITSNNFGGILAGPQSFVGVGDGTHWLGLTGNYELSYVAMAEYCASGSSSGWSSFVSGISDFVSLHTWDMYINISSSGTIALYKDGATSPTYTYSGDLTCAGEPDWGGALTASFYSGGTPGNELSQANFSEIAVSTSDTRGHRLGTIAPGGNSSTFTWTGSYSNVNGLIYNDGSFIYTTTSGKTAGMLGVPSALSGIWTIAGAKIALRGAAASGAPTTFYSAMKPAGGSSFINSCSQSFTATFTNYGCYYAVNPRTSAAWSQGDFTGIQFGPAN